MAVSPFIQPDFTSQLGSTYKTNIDNSIAAMYRIGANFAPRAQDTPDMTVRIGEGRIFIPHDSTVTYVSAQNSPTVTAPTTTFRQDRIVLDEVTGAAELVNGVEGGSLPDVPLGKVPCAYMVLSVGQTEITNSGIVDERCRPPDGRSVDIVELLGDFAVGEKVMCEMHGNVVTISDLGSTLGHDSGNFAVSANGAIPQVYRPNGPKKVVCYASGSKVTLVEISTSGSLIARHYNWDGTDKTGQTSVDGFTISYINTWVQV